MLSAVMFHMLRSGKMEIIDLFYSIPNSPIYHVSVARGEIKQGTWLQPSQ